MSDARSSESFGLERVSVDTSAVQALIEAMGPVLASLPTQTNLRFVALFWEVDGVYRSDGVLTVGIDPEPVDRWYHTQGVALDSGTEALIVNGRLAMAYKGKREIARKLLRHQPV